MRGRKSFPTLTRSTPDGGPTSVASSLRLFMSSFLGGKYRKSNTPPSPQKLLLGVVHRTCKDIDLEDWVKGFPPAHDPSRPSNCDGCPA